MRDKDCVELLQWMLPLLRLRWAGFRRVRGQVCKRITRRLKELALENANDYRQYLESHEEEWPVADSLCRVTISRFCRGKGVFAFLGSEVLPTLGENALEAGRYELAAWSAGCGSGEEPYTLALLWEFELRERLSGMDLEILGTEIDERLLQRAAQAVYPKGCLKDLPPEWLRAAFETADRTCRLRPSHRDRVRFQRHDIREEPVQGPYDLVLCRNLAFTYFDEALQVETAERLGSALRDGGALVLGSHEALPPEAGGYEVWSEKHKVYRRLDP